MWKGIKRGIALLLSVVMVGSATQIPTVTTRAEDSGGMTIASGSALTLGNGSGENSTSNTSQDPSLDMTNPENIPLEGYVEEYFDLGEVETSAIPMSFFGLSDGKVDLISGTATNWIDRLDLTGDAQVIKNLYNTLVEASDNDGVDDYLIEDSYFVLSTENNNVSSIKVAEITGTLDGTYSEADAKTKVSEVASEILANYSLYIRAAYDAFDRDHPEVFWLDGGTQAVCSSPYTMTGTEGAYTVSYTVTIQFVLKNSNFDIRATGYQSQSFIEEAIANVNSKVSSLVTEANKKSTVVDKITYFNKQLTKTNEYNTSSDLSNIGHNCRECISALTGSTGTTGPVCEAYARAFKVLCDEAGIPCVLVDGQAKNSKDSKGEAHMWNYVQVDNEWLAVDVTWNDPTGGTSGAESGYESEDWLLVYANSEISDGMTFIESHPVENQASSTGVAFTNGPELALSVNSTNIYYVSDDTGLDTNSGTQEAPFKTLEKALTSASNNAIIYILDDIEVIDTTSTDAPLVIEKNVTIEGISSSTLPAISVSAGGIILGADVTFKNIQLGITGFLRPGIAANGHTLKLINVQQNTTNLRPLQIYGGTFFDYSTEGFGMGTDYGSDIRGSVSNIIIEGGSYEAIYAGSTNGSVVLPVNISVAKGSDLTLTKGIYVGSTVKNPQDTSTSGQIPVLDSIISVLGTVNIEVKDNASVNIVDAVAENHTVNLSTSGMGYYSFVVNLIDSLTVNSGTFVPAAGSSFGYTAVDIELIGSSDNKATLDLSVYDSNEMGVKVKNFTGSENAILILESDSILTIEGVLSGKNIEFRTSGGGVSASYWSSKETPGYSGWIKYGTKYIDSSQGDGTFVITNPYITQKGITFTDNSSATNSWTIIEGELEAPPKLLDFIPSSKTVTLSACNAKNGFGIDVETEFSEDEWTTELAYIPFEYKVTYTSSDGIIEYIKQSSTWDEDGYCQCNYTTSTINNPKEDILMKFEPRGETQICIEKGTNDLPVGIYDIDVIAMVESGTIERSFTLTIINDNAVETTTTLTVPTGTPTYDYASTITVEAQVQTKSEDSNIGTLVSEGKAQLYINDVAYGEAVSVQEESSQWSWNIPITKENDFCIGENSFKVKYFGTNDFAPSESTTTIYVKQTESSISYGGEFVSLEYAYDGNIHAFIPEAVVSIKSMDEMVTFVEDAVLNKDYRIVYKVGDAFTETPPESVGTYPVYLTAIVTDYWIDSEIQVGNIVIVPCEPTIIFTSIEFNYTQGIDSITASGTIELKVVGAEGGLNPEGTVTIVAGDGDSDESTKITIANDIPLEDGKATITFSNVEPEKLYHFSFSYTPISEAPYESTSGDYYARYISINSNKSTNYTLNGVTKEQLYFPEGQEITVNAGTRDGYSFKEWSISSEKEIVISDINTSQVTFIMPDVNVGMTARWASSDKSLQSVSVSDVAGEINGDTINVVLPYTTEVLPKNTEDISITLTDNCASVKDLKVENEGKKWTFIVEAEDKTTKQYTINVSIADIPVYTVIYTDGLDDVEIFPDQKYEVEVGTDTPPFVGTLIHPEYELVSWKQEISDTVLTNVTYEAVLKKHTWNTLWTNDDTHHWHKCDNTDCPITENSQKNGYGVHTGGTATCKSLAVCEVCNVSYGTKDSTNHEGGTELRNEKEATTTATGYTGDTYCLGCGEKIVSGKEIPIITSIPTPEPEEPTVTPEPEPTVTPEPEEPTVTPEPEEPTVTPEPVTPKPTATSTPKPTATSTPKPTVTSTPKPTATSTPKPTATSTPKPTATSTPTPKPTATSTPKPTATSTPKPTATSTPKPTATSTPKPTATSTPKPTATSTLKPTTTSIPTPTTRPIIIIPNKPKVTVTPTPTEPIIPSVTVTPEATVTEKPLVKPTIKPRPVIIPSKPKVTVTPKPTEVVTPSVTPEATVTEKPLVKPTTKPRPVIIPSKPKVTVTPTPTEPITPSVTVTPEATVTEKPLVNPTTKPRPVIIPSKPKVTVTPKPTEVVTPSMTPEATVTEIPEIIIIPSITPELPKDENVSEQEKEDAFGYTMNIGEIIQLSFPSMEIGRKGYQWTSSNETVAVVNNGMVTARSAGEVTISLQSYNKKTKEYITIASIKLRVLDK